MMNKNRHRRSAFTLLELMIVIVILGLLATVVMPKLMGRPEQTRRVKAVIQIAQFADALDLFNLDTGRYPTTAEGLAVLVTNPGIKGYKTEGYMDKIPLDPWGNPYLYISPGMHGNEYEIKSYGKDGENGGRDDDADIESWNLEAAS